MQDDLQVSPGNPELETVKSSRDNGTNGLPNRLPDPSALHCLPGELHLKIFDLLDDDPETSACLGLTCKKLYPIFVALLLKPKLLREFCIKCEERRHPGACDLDFHRSGWKTLKELLIDWNPQIDDV